ncbi:hypothetical protein L218DRAFT_182644 [Marasmius fiardii PR-910]|nr:hypothetical protein L218DRAFT_182644 [Marasmius fiardii PR-910]
MAKSSSPKKPSKSPQKSSLKSKSTTRNLPEPESELPQPMTLFWLVIPLLVAVFYAWYLQKNDAMPAVLSKLFRNGQVEESNLYDLRILTDRTIFDVVDLKGKGKGLVANRDIKVRVLGSPPSNVFEPVALTPWNNPCR